MRSEFYGGQIAALMCSIASRKGKQHKASDFMLDEILTSAADKQEAEMRAYFEQLASKGVAKKV